MELKFVRSHEIMDVEHGFNRTFMELKWMSRRSMLTSFRSFNRTFMELKSSMQGRSSHNNKF